MTYGDGKLMQPFKRPQPIWKGGGKWEKDGGNQTQGPRAGLLFDVYV
jgi:hypothetical protein